MGDNKANYLTKKDFPDDAHGHIRNMTDVQKKHFIDWVNGLEYITNNRWPGVLISREKWEWSNKNFSNFEKAEKEYTAAALLASYLGREVKMLPEDYNFLRKLPQKGCDAIVANERTLDFKNSKRVQESYNTSRHQALDVFITVPSFMNLNRACEQLNGAIKQLKKSGNKENLESEVYIAQESENIICHASVKSSGDVHWDTPRRVAGSREAIPHEHPVHNNITQDSQKSSFRNSMLHPDTAKIEARLDALRQPKSPAPSPQSPAKTNEKSNYHGI